MLVRIIRTPLKKKAETA